MSLIRFPLEITQSEQVPCKQESWSSLAGKGFFVLAIILFFAYVFIPLWSQQ